MNAWKKQILTLACCGALFGVSSLCGAEPKSYQVTGPVLELTATTITVQKGDEKWEIGRGASTKVKGDLKVGSKVTVYYKMTAAEIEVKEPSEKKSKK